ncbi:hypothetical protein LIA77_09641 [Sarocladium implicatum]|nr:hypothetical protein LIA77_09641 [Sarocladium implicatum]
MSQVHLEGRARAVLADLPYVLCNWIYRQLHMRLVLTSRPGLCFTTGTGIGPCNLVPAGWLTRKELAAHRAPGRDDGSVIHLIARIRLRLILNLVRVTRVQRTILGRPYRSSTTVSFFPQPILSIQLFADQSHHSTPVQRHQQVLVDLDKSASSRA